MYVLTQSSVSSNPENKTKKQIKYKRQYTQTKTALPRGLIFVCVKSSCCFPICCRDFFPHSAKTSLIDGAMFQQVLAHRITFCLIHHNIAARNIVNESHFSQLRHLLPVSQATYLYQRDHLPETSKICIAGQRTYWPPQLETAAHAIFLVKL